MVSAEVVQAPFWEPWGSVRTTDAGHTEHAQAGGKKFAVIRVLVLWQTIALVIQVFAICMSRRAGGDGPWFAVSATSSALTYGSALWALTRPELARAVRNIAVI